MLLFNNNYYYGILILILCILDFSGWTSKHKGLFFFLFEYIYKLNRLLSILSLYIYKLVYKLLITYKEIDYLYFNLYKVINFNSNESKNNIIYKFFYSKKIYIGLSNPLNNTFDLLGRSYLIFNTESIKDWKFISLILEFISLLNKDKNFLDELYLNKYFNKYLFYTRPKFYDFFFSTNIIYYLNNKKVTNLSLNYIIINLRSLYKDIFLTNQFKHSGFFEVFELYFLQLLLFVS